MKAAFYCENGGPEVMQYGDVAEPDVAPDTVLIAVEWISIEGGDLLNRLVTPLRQTPFVPGYQAAGKVVATGAAVTRFKVGDAVVGFNWSGSHAALFAVPEHYACAVPPGLALKAAATIPVPFGTAHDSLFEYGKVKPGETVLVQGAAGGVGLAVQAGATVIGTAASAERLERLAGYGMQHGINYREENIPARVREITGGRGADLVLDLAGGKGKDDLVDAIRAHGRYMVVGAATGELPSFGFFEMIRKALEIYGISSGRDMHTPRMQALLAGIGAQMARGGIEMPIDREFALSDVVAAHRHVAQGHPFGRVLMYPG